jgi:glycosyltransferase involved in cell wall biosynthesis
MNENRKPRIALVAMGVMGGGPIGDGIPVLVDLFDQLSEHYELVYYSLQPVDRSRVPSRIKIRQATSLKLPGRLKYFLIFLRMVMDHLRNPFRLVFAVSAFPTGNVALRFGKLFNVPVAVQLIALEAVAIPEINYGNLLHPLLARVTRKVCAETDSLIVVADYQGMLAKKLLPTQREITSLPLRINPRRFQYRKRNVTFPVEFIHIAYYNPVKDQDSMFEAFALVSKEIDCKLTVIGDGYENDKVKKFLWDLGIADKVIFKGLIHQSEIPACFKRAHILLHMARFETGCAVIQEAMASGVAVCGTKVGLLSDIGDQYAAVVSVGDVPMMRDRMLKLVHDQTYYAAISNSAYEWISTFDNVWSAENYKFHIDKLIHQV